VAYYELGQYIQLNISAAFRACFKCLVDDRNADEERPKVAVDRLADVRRGWKSMGKV
jgi:hypothetical protein